MSINKIVSRKILSITGSFEGGDLFANLTGDFDGQGMSFGILQWNFGQNTLGPIFRKMRAIDEPRMKDLLGKSYFKKLMNVIEKPVSDQLEFAWSINDSRNRIIQPWKSKFKALGEDEILQDAQLWGAQKIMNKSARMCCLYELKEELSLSLMFDICVQNGGIKKRCKLPILDEITAIPSLHLHDGTWEEKVRIIIARICANSSNPRWINDVMSRKMTCATGRGKVHGRHYDLFKDFGIVRGAYY